MSGKYYTFRIDGPVMPYVRMTNKGKFVKYTENQRGEIVPSRQSLYLADRDRIVLAYREQMSRAGWTPFPSGVPLAFIVDYYAPPRKAHVGDTDNILKALKDAAQGVVFANDCWVDADSILRRVVRRIPSHALVLVARLDEVEWPVTR